MPVAVTLTPSEYLFAAHAGFLRQATNVCRGRRDAYGYVGSGYDIHVLGAVGEFVVARALGLFWSGPGTLRAPDVASLQVRTRSRSHYELIVHPDDDDDAAFVLVTGGGLQYHVHGWIEGRLAKKREWWRDPAGGRPAYFVPQRELWPLDNLKAYGVAA